MKKVYFILVLALLSFTGLYSQGTSVMHPLLITWNVDGRRVSLKKALYGTERPSNLSLSVFFDAQQVKKWQKQGITLQFRWYYYLSTRRKLIKVENVALSEGHLNSDGSFVVSSTLKVVQPGWWEVQIVSSADRRFISYAGLDRFQIFIRARGYTMR